MIQSKVPQILQHSMNSRIQSIFYRSLNSKISSEWEKLTRKDGKIVYYNSLTRETVDSLPNDISSSHETNAMQASESTSSLVPINFKEASKIEGQESQIVHIDLKPNQKLRAETGSMLYMTEGIELETSTAGGISQGFKRLMTGENFFVSDFSYNGTGEKGTVAFGTDYPSKIIEVPLESFGGSLICQKGAFLCGSSSINIEMEFAKKFGVGFFGGEGFVLQRLTGEGTAFIKAGGTLIEKDLKEGEVLRISSGCLVGFEPTVEYDITQMKGFKNVVFGGEGLFVTTLTGPGRVFIQGLPFDRMVDQIARRVPGGGTVFMPMGLGGGSGGGETGEGSVDTASAGAMDETVSGEEVGSSPDHSGSDDSMWGVSDENKPSDNAWDNTESSSSETGESFVDDESVSSSVSNFFKDFFGDN